MSTPDIRLAMVDDFAAIELLNHSVVDLTSPMDAERIQQLHSMSSYHRVITQDSQLVAFLLVLGPDCAYDSVNYQPGYSWSAIETIGRLVQLVWAIYTSEWTDGGF